MVRICIVLSACLALAVSCVSSAGSGNRYDTVYYRPEFASGFDIAGWKDSCSRVIRVYAGWQEADSSAMELFLARGGERPPEGFSGQVIEDHASRLAVMSSSYVGFLACLGACDSVAAVSGKHFISDVTIRSRSDEIVETGSDSAPDYEGLLAAEADLALIYGVASRSPMEAKLEELGIPYMYMGEYLEPDPLGRAEWMVVLSEILGDREKGEAVFKPFWQMEKKDIEATLRATEWAPADLGYFRGGGYSSRFMTRSEMPVTMIRLNIIKGLGPVMQIAEGYTVKLPEDIADAIWKRTDYTWPCTWFAPCVNGSDSFKDAYSVMNSWGANHGAIGYGHVGGELITLCSMLRIPVCMHNVSEDRIFRPAVWNAFGMDKEGADYRACAAFGPLYR